MWTTSQGKPQLRIKAQGSCAEGGQDGKWGVSDGLSPKQLDESTSLPPLFLVEFLEIWHLSLKLTIQVFFLMKLNNYISGLELLG